MDSLNTAVILAGGLGTRLKSVSGDTPKPLMPINNKVFLDYLIDNLRKHNINDIYLCISYNFEKFTYYYKNNDLKFIIEDNPLGTGGAIKLAFQEVNQKNILVLNGDTFFDINFNDFIKNHFKSKADISLATKKMEKPYRYGTVDVNGNRVLKFNEKKEIDKGIINCGIYILNSNINKFFPKEDKFSFEKDILEKHTSELNIVQQLSDGYFIDIGIPEDYVRATEYFKIK